MPRARDVVERFRGRRGLRAEVGAARDDIAELRQLLLHLSHVVAQLNHDVRSGADDALPLFYGYAERLRTDADTVVSASAVIDRQLARLVEHLDRPAGPAPDDG